MELYCCASSTFPRSLPHHHRRRHRPLSYSTDDIASVRVRVHSLSFPRTSPQPSLFLGFTRVRCSASDDVSTFVSDRSVEEKEEVPSTEAEQIEVEAVADLEPSTTEADQVEVEAVADVEPSTTEADQVEVEAVADVEPPPTSEVESSEDEEDQSEDKAATEASKKLLVDSAIAYGVASTEESAGESEENLVSDILKQLNLELNSEDTLPILLYGAGALVTIWLSSVVVSILDSIPLVPKVMELVGLGFSIWFTSKYLIFKERREELLSKIGDLKDQILGSLEE